MGRHAKIKAIIYVRGTVEEIEQQIVECYALCSERGYAVWAIAQDLPGETEGFEGALRLRGPGTQIVVARAELLPEYFESATGALPGPRALRGPAPRSLSPRQRRPRPVR